MKRARGEGRGNGSRPSPLAPRPSLLFRYNEPMQLWWILLFLSGAFPLGLAWFANRRTALAHTLLWGFAAWALWGWAGFLSYGTPQPRALVVRYVALCLTGCVAVAVLGARRPGLAAWNFVVVGLLAVLLLPLVENFASGGPLHLEWFRTALVGGVIAVGVLNYLPTRLGPAAVLLGIVVAAELIGLAGPEELAQKVQPIVPRLRLGLALVPWLGLWTCWRRPRLGSECDRLWLAFRDRFGLVWGQRLREQFNRSAFHSGWPVFLSWQGLRRKAGSPPIDPDTQTVMAATLCALMKRFGPSDPD